MALLKNTVPKQVWISAGILVILALVAYTNATRPMPPPQKISQVIIGNTTIHVEVADTDASREQGLSGRNGLAPQSGMLFIFDAPMRAGFWMKDMNFDLDMIFADARGKIVTVDTNVPASSYHQNPPQVFYPSAPVIYVLEVPAGFATAHAIAEGQTIVLK